MKPLETIFQIVTSLGAIVGAVVGAVTSLLLLGASIFLFLYLLVHFVSMMIGLL